MRSSWLISIGGCKAHQFQEFACLHQQGLLFPLGIRGLRLRVEHSVQLATGLADYRAVSHRFISRARSQFRPPLCYDRQLIGLKLSRACPLSLASQGRSPAPGAGKANEDSGLQRNPNTGGERPLNGISRRKSFFGGRQKTKKVKSGDLEYRDNARQRAYDERDTKHGRCILM